MDNERYREGENLYDNKDEDYGLPKVSYDPVNREETREPIIMNPKDQQAKKNTYKKESSWPIVVGIIVIIAIAGVLVYLFLIRTPEAPPVVQDPTPPVIEQEIPDAEEFESVADTEWTTPPVAAVKPEVGSIATINARTGQAYIIGGSFIDVDLARDYGNKLAGEGVSTTIIEPYGKVKYYRLSVANYPTVGEALENIEQLKATYGDNIWVLKY